MALDFFETIRGQEVQVFADSFDGYDRDSYAPEEVWASTAEGEPFELTDEETERLAIKAIELYYEPDYD